MSILRKSGVIFGLFWFITLTQAQTPSSESIDDYIHNAWDTLSRSMTDCASLVDPKLTTEPVLYLPHELPIPPEVEALQKICKVHVAKLPRSIDHLGALQGKEVSTPGLLYLPNKYVVPGGRFNEMYGWDSYFILLGLLRDGRTELARGMVENFFFEIEHYGGILNANRTYYFSRSQPPFLSSMIRDVYEAEVAACKQADADAWLKKAYTFAQHDHALWLTGFHRAGDTGLARYYDLGKGPVPEMADDDAYYQDVIRWLLAHPDIHTNYLVDGPETPNTAQQARLAITSCDPRTSQVCARAHVEGRWLTSDFYEGDRAMRESGFDPAFRMGPFSGSTHHYAPTCLNSLLYKYETDLAWMAEKTGHTVDVSKWKHQAAARKAAINKYLWNEKKGMYFDYDFLKHRQSDYVYIATFYPLWAGVASAAQAKAVEANLKLFNQPGGIPMSTFNSGTQWDLPYGWAPTTWVTIAGLARAGDLDDARDISRKFMHTIEVNFDQDHTIREKYDVVSGSSKLDVATGYKTNVIGFGWTNAAYLKMKELLSPAGTQAAAQ